MTALLPQNLEFSPVPVGAWPARPFQLVTLWDMQRLLADIFYFATHQVDEWHCEVRREVERRGRHSNLTTEEIEKARVKLGILKKQCVNVQFNGILKRLSDIEVLFIGAEYSENEQVSLERMTFQLEELTRAISRDLRPRLIMLVEADGADKYEQNRLFGSKVYTNFKSTRHDVVEAGNCFAVGRYTACVFHCMRVLEKGLHALVHEINARHNAGIAFKKEIEAKNWGEILGKIDKALMESNSKNLNPQPSSSERQFYSKATIQFEYFLKAWRNDVSHSRSKYGKPEAERVMEHVKAFMKQISTKLTELPKETDNLPPEN